MTGLPQTFRTAPRKNDLLIVICLWAMLLRQTLQIFHEKRFMAEWSAGAVRPRELAFFQVVLLLGTAAATVQWIKRWQANRMLSKR